MSCNMPQTPKVEIYNLQEYILSTLYTNNFIYQGVIYRKISLELCKTWIRQGLQECALTHNVATQNRLLFGLEDKHRPRQESVSGTGSPSFLACHQSLSKGSSPSPASQRKAEKTSSRELSDGQHAYPHLTPEQCPRSDRPGWAGHPALSIFIPCGGCLSPSCGKSCWARAAHVPSLSRESGNFIMWAASWEKHIFSLQRADATQIWYIICKWFQSLFVYSKEITGISNCILM